MGWTEINMGSRGLGNGGMKIQIQKEVAPTPITSNTLQRGLLDAKGENKHKHDEESNH